MDKITTIFFDIDDTLLNHSEAEEKGIRSIHKKHYKEVSYKRFKRIWMLFARRYWKLFEEKKLTFSEQRIQRIMHIWEEFGKKVSRKEADVLFKEYLSFYEYYWQPFPQVVPTIKKLQKKGFVLGIISNGNTKQQIQKLQKIKIYPYLDKKLIITSELAGHAKPEKQIYIHAQKQANVSGKKILFISNDAIKDLEPAKRIGWRVMLFDYFQLFPKHRSIKDFKELYNFLL